MIYELAHQQNGAPGSCAWVGTVAPTMYFGHDYCCCARTDGQQDVVVKPVQSLPHFPTGLPSPGGSFLPRAAPRSRGQVQLAKPGLQPSIVADEAESDRSTVTRSTEQSLNFEFCPDETKIVKVADAPLGMWFLGNMPLTVTGFNESDAGVQRSWMFKNDGAEPPDNLGYTTEVELVAEGMGGPAKSPELRIGMELPLNLNTPAVPGAFVVEFFTGSEARQVTFAKKPFGIDIDLDKNGLTVRSVRPRSHGAQLGVQPGWELKVIMGQEATGMDLLSVMAMFQSGMDNLPAG